MTEQIRQTRQVNSDGTASVQTTEVADDANQKADNASVAARIVWFIGGVLAILLAFRFVFILLGASSSNGFTDFIYTVSHPFAAPFFGIFGYTQTYGEAKFELSTLVAILVYLLVAYGVVKLVTIRKSTQV